jgi:hypothetical protein
MPKDEIDYSNTIIYKIYCKDKNIHDIYVGHTTNFIKRKYQHKNFCNNIEKKLKIYETIRQNGGWDNWDMIEISKYNCKNKQEAIIKENQHYEELKASLNVKTSYIDKTLFFCDVCKLQCSNKKNYELHINCELHKKKEFEPDRTNLSPKIAVKLTCKLCNYECSKQSDYDKHLLTSKHKNRTNLNILEQNVAENLQLFECDKCSKTYKARNSLWYHKRKCQGILNKENEEETFSIDKDDIIKFLMKENSEFKDLLMEQNKMVMKMCENSPSSITNSNINSHNKTFNLNVFLNEHCKDAMNIMDFVDSVKLQMSDLESVGKLGFVEGISNIILRNLRALDVHKRPVHCSDSKREVMYIKDEDKWEKEGESKQKLRKAIKKIANKNYVLIPQFKEIHPDCSKASSPYSDQYNKLIIEAMGGSGNEDFDNENKIIRKIAKEVVIDKSI